MRLRTILIYLCAPILFGLHSVRAEPATALTPTDLIGTWSGELIHGRERTSIALVIAAGQDDKLDLALVVPVVHLARVPLGAATPTIDGDRIQLGPFDLRYDATRGTLTGDMPKAFIPVYTMRLRLARNDAFAMPERATIDANPMEPVWTYDAGSALWAGPRVADGVIYVGGQDGKLHAIDATTHRRRWVFQAGGAIRVRPSIDHGAVYLQADDGYAYAVDARTGKQRWRTQVNRTAVERLPFDNPKSRFDRFGSDVLIDGARVYLGTHEGRLVALSAENGDTLWAYATQDAILAAPALRDGRLYFGSFDHHVYAVDAEHGALIWKYDTREAVVSTPALAQGKVLIGTRGYDFLALDAEHGTPSWTQYLWFSWVESSAATRDGMVYVGSSDAAAAYAFDVASGARRWATDVQGWAWGQPLVTDTRVYLGTASQVGYLAQHQGAFIALDRVDGRAQWRYVLPGEAKGAYGFAGSADLDDTHVYASALDGKLYAFAR
jgi:outer membrane protein assembly factor BamB